MKDRWYTCRPLNSGLFVVAMRTSCPYKCHAPDNPDGLWGAIEFRPPSVVVIAEITYLFGSHCAT